MLRLFVCVLGASVAAAALQEPLAAQSNSTSASDRARIAMLVYQSASARQADLRRGDAATNELRAKADSAERIAAATRADLTAARAEGAQARKRARDLEQKLEQQEGALAEAIERYTRELAQRDEDYARERSVLISTGERLLRTSEGRRVLDLYNAGGEANWVQAKQILDESHKVRRALDARDTARLYLQAKSKGLETAPSVLTRFEAVVVDDPGQVEDWRSIALLRRELGQHDKALQALDTAQRLVSTPRERWGLVIERARIVSDLRGPAEAIPIADEALAIMRAILTERHRPADHRRLVESLSLVAALNLGIAAETAGHPGFDIARAAALEAELHANNTRTGHGYTAPQLLVETRLLLGEIARIHGRDFPTADAYYESAISQARKNVANRPDSLVEKARLASALRTKAAAWLAESQVDGLDAPLQEAITISEASRRSDAASLFAAMALGTDYYNLARILKLQRRFREAEAALLSGLKLAGEFGKPAVNADPRWWLMQEELGSIYMMSGRFNDAARAFETTLAALDGHIAASGPNGTAVDHRAHLFASRLKAQIGSAYGQKGDPASAAQWLSKALAEFETQQRTNGSEAVSLGHAAALLNFAEIAEQTGDREAAVANWKRALAITAEGSAGQSPSWRPASLHAGIQLHWGKALARRGDMAGAREKMAQARAEFEQLRRGHPNLVDIYTEFVDTLVWTAALGGQGTSWQTLLSQAGSVRGFDSTTFVARSLVNVGTSLQSDGQLQQARQLFQDAVAAYEPMASRSWSEEQVYISALNGLGFAYQNEDRIPEAARYFEAAHKAAQAALGRNPGIGEAREQVALTAIGLGDVALESGRTADAQKHFADAERIYTDLKSGGLDPSWYDFDLEYLYRRLGTAALYLGQADRALAFASQSARISAAHGDLHYKRALRDSHAQSAAALDELDRAEEARREWAAAFEGGSDLLRRPSDGFTARNIHAQAKTLLQLSDEAQGAGRLDEALDHVAAAEQLVERAGDSLESAFAALRLAIARRKLELAVAKGDAAGAAAIASQALSLADHLPADRARAIDVRFERARLGLSEARRLAAAGDRSGAGDRLRAARELLGQLAQETDRAYVHRMHATASWWMAEYGVGGVTWEAASGELHRLKARGYSTKSEDKLLTDALARARNGQAATAAR